MGCHYQMDVTQDITALTHALQSNCLDPFMGLLRKLNDPFSGSPPVSLIISDCVVPFPLDAAQLLGGLPVAVFWCAAASGFLAFAQYLTVLDKSIVPLKDYNYMKDGSLDVIVDRMPASMKGMRLKDFPTSIRITDKNDFVFHFVMDFIERSCHLPIIFNTFETLEHAVLDDISTMTSGGIYPIGPINCQLNHVLENKDELSSLRSNLWKEDPQCLEWLDSKKPKSVVYVSFGSITTMTNEQLVELAKGLAKCNHPFLWIIRPDIVTGDSAIIPSELLNEVKDRSFLASWCDQERVLNHSAIGVFLTHSGWNSTLESISSGVPILSWPFFADQQTNCWYSCNKWGIGMEINSDVNCNEVEKQIRQVMEGEKGKELKNKAAEWRRLAEEATSPNGSSYLSFNKLINLWRGPFI